MEYDKFPKWEFEGFEFEGEFLSFTLFFKSKRNLKVLQFALNEYFSEARENVTFTQFFKENFVELTTSLFGYFEMYEFYEEEE